MSVPFLARVLFDYVAVESTELSVSVGQEVFIDEVNESGWCLARIGEATGWIPTDYIERVEGSVDAIHQAEPEPQPSVVPLPLPVPVPVAVAEHELVLEAEPELEPVQVEPVAVSSRVADPVPAPAPVPLPQPVSNARSNANIKEFTPEPGVEPALPAPPTNYASSPPAASAAPRSAAPAAASANSSLPPPGSDKVCSFCHDWIRGAFVMAKDQVFHPQHFQCHQCGAELGGKAYLEKDGKFYDENCFYECFNPKCGQCAQTIKGPYISALEQTWHAQCFTCFQCHKPFPGNQFRKHENKPYCESCFGDMHAPKCNKCKKPITGQVFEALEQKYHLQCFCCAFDDHVIGEGVMFHIHEDKVWCPTHFEELFLSRCSGCAQVIKGQFIKIFELSYHSECWKCAHCAQVLRPEACGQENNRFYCRSCLDANTLEPTIPDPIDFSKKAAPAAAKPQAKAAPLAASARSPMMERQPSFERQPSNRSSPTNSSPSPAKLDLSSLQLDPDSVLAQKLAAMPKYEDPANCPSFPLDLLRVKNNANKPPQVDPAKRELYLSDPDFQTHFKMPKDQFLKLPQWKRDTVKKSLDLF